MPDLLRAVLAGLVSAIGTFGCAWLGLLQQGWSSQDGLPALLWPFAIGGASGAIAAVLALRFMLRSSDFVRRFALAASVHALVSICMTMLLFGLEYRIYFARWHSDAFTLSWAFETAFTLGGSAFLFLSTGLVLFVPWAVICWLVVALLLARPLKPSVADARRTDNPSLVI